MNNLIRYLRVLRVFARNSLVRSMSFRVNFFIECASSLVWAGMNLGLFALIYQYSNSIGGWSKYPYFVFLATMQFIYSLNETFFVPNAEELSELVRTGDLDFAL